MKNDYIVCVCGDASRAAYLIKGEKNVLFDAGMAYSADKMIKNIKRELGDRPLDAVLLSHSHYDHISGVPFLRKEWPDLVVYGSAYAKKILEKPSAKKTMRELSDAAAQGPLPYFEKAFVEIEIVTPRGSNNARVWDTSNRAIQVILNNLKGIFFRDDDMEHMAFSVVGRWGEKGVTLLRISDSGQIGADQSRQVLDEK